MGLRVPRDRGAALTRITLVQEQAGPDHCPSKTLTLPGLILLLCSSTHQFGEVYFSQEEVRGFQP